MLHQSVVGARVLKSRFTTTLGEHRRYPAELSVICADDMLAFSCDMIFAPLTETIDNSPAEQHDLVALRNVDRQMDVIPLKPIATPRHTSTQRKDSMDTNPVGWFEIYVQDMARATKFYESVLNTKLEKLNTPAPEIEMTAFPMAMERTGASGALAKDGWI